MCSDLCDGVEMLMVAADVLVSYSSSVWLGSYSFGRFPKTASLIPVRPTSDWPSQMREYVGHQ